MDQINDYVCKCEEGWYGKNCDFTNCPTELNGRLINGTCYTFESEKKSYNDAIEFCKKNRSARLFEPRTPFTLNDLVITEALEYFKRNPIETWLGINDIENDGEFV